MKKGIFIIISLALLGLPFSKVSKAPPVSFYATNRLTSSSLATSLIAHWNFDEASGNAADCISGETLNNSNSCTYVAGLRNNAVHLVAGSSQFLQHLGDANLQTGEIDFSVGVRVKFAAITGTKYFVTKTDFSGHDEYEVGYNVVHDRFYFGIHDNGSVTATNVYADTFGSPTTAVWYSIMATYKASTHTLSISVNGGAQNTQTSTGITLVGSTSAIFYIGTYANIVGYPDADIDETSFWKRTLSTTDVTTWYNAGTPLNGCAYP